MKRPGVIELYRGGSAPPPSGDMDAQILAAARTSRPRSHLPFALAAAGLAAIFIARWYAPGETPAPQITVTNFGTEEGRAQTWLSSFQPPVTATGPGSQEGIP